MNQTTTMTAMRTTLHSRRRATPAEPRRSLIGRWLAALRPNDIEAEHRLLLDLAVDHSDLEWRILELDRRSQSGFSVGGSRF